MKFIISIDFIDIKKITKLIRTDKISLELPNNIYIIMTKTVIKYLMEQYQIQEAFDSSVNPNTDIESHDPNN